MNHKSIVASFAGPVLTAVLALIGLAASPAAPAHRILSEFTFDDGPDNSGPTQGYGTLNDLDGTTRLTLSGNNPPLRSELDEGRYGRAGKFSGGSGNRIVIQDLPTSFKDDILGLVAWLKPDFDDEAGEILTVENNWSLYLQEGMLKLSVATSGGLHTTTFIEIPDDDEWHHVTFQWHMTGDSATSGYAAIEVDGDSSGVKHGIPLPPGVAGEVNMGDDYTGMIDEVIIYDDEAGPALAFDRDPTYCPANRTCLEDVITVTPVDHAGQTWTFQVPVRFKLVYDPTECTSTSPCPIVIDISGGFACADDYDTVSEVEFMSEHGLIVVAVDPYCETRELEDSDEIPQEVPQFIAVKNYLFNDSGSPFNDSASPAYQRALTNQYMASGCSHGANQVLHWVLGDETDKPDRTFSRSGLTSISEMAHCGLHHDPTMCDNVADTYEDLFSWLTDSTPHDDGDLAFRDQVTVDWNTIAAANELAMIWGRDTTPLGSPTCKANGDYDCLEQGTGVTLAGRHARDMWQAAEGTTPTGYFVEDSSGDCLHCPDASKASFQCGVCFLKVGRANMFYACTGCLLLSDGGAAAACSVMNNW